MAESAFFLPRGDDRYRPTAHTSGPWTPDAQHFGPPSALLARSLEALPSAQDALLARVTVEILGPAPLTEMSVHARVERPGRSVELLSAELAAAGRPVARASAWRIVGGDTREVATGGDTSWPKPDECEPERWPEGWFGGYLAAMDWRHVSGAVTGPGPAGVWVRQRVALVDGEEPSPLQRLFAVADSGNGISTTLDPTHWWFINSELTVHLRRPPSGEWIGLDAATAIGPGGTGTATSTLRDLDGTVGVGAQALMVRPR